MPDRISTYSAFSDAGLSRNMTWKKANRVRCWEYLVWAELPQKLKVACLIWIAPFRPLMLSQGVTGISHGGQQICEGHPKGCSTKIMWPLQEQLRCKDPTRTASLQSYAASSGQAMGEQIIHTGMSILQAGSAPLQSDLHELTH